MTKRKIAFCFMILFMCELNVAKAPYYFWNSFSLLQFPKWVLEYSNLYFKHILTILIFGDISILFDKKDFSIPHLWFRFVVFLMFVINSLVFITLVFRNVGLEKFYFPEQDYHYHPLSILLLLFMSSITYIIFPACIAIMAYLDIRKINKGTTNTKSTFIP